MARATLCAYRFGRGCARCMLNFISPLVHFAPHLDWFIIISQQQLNPDTFDSWSFAGITPQFFSLFPPSWNYYHAESNIIKVSNHAYNCFIHLVSNQVYIYITVFFSRIWLWQRRVAFSSTTTWIKRDVVYCCESCCCVGGIRSISPSVNSVFIALIQSISMLNGPSWRSVRERPTVLTFSRNISTSSSWIMPLFVKTKSRKGIYVKVLLPCYLTCNILLPRLFPIALVSWEIVDADINRFGWRCRFECWQNICADLLVLVKRDIGIDSCPNMVCQTWRILVPITVYPLASSL